MANDVVTRKTDFPQGLKVKPDSVLGELSRCRDLILKEEVELVSLPSSERHNSVESLNNIQAAWQKIAELSHQVLEMQDFGQSVHTELEELLLETDGITCPHCRNTHLHITFNGEIVCRDCHSYLALSKAGKLPASGIPEHIECPHCHQKELEVILTGLAFCRNCVEDFLLVS